MKLKVTVNGTVYDVEVEPEEKPLPPLGAFTFGPGATVDHTAPAVPTARVSSEDVDGDALRSTLSGTVTRVDVDPGQSVTEGQVVLVLEAMKMETEITAPMAGTVETVEVVPGDAVSVGQVLVRWAEDRPG